MNSMLSTSKPKKNMLDISKTVGYSYDLRGLLKTALFTSNNQGITNTYTGLGDIKTSISTMGGISRQVKYNYFYELNANRKQVVHPDGHYFSYNLDGLNRVTALSDSANSSLLTIKYRPNGRRETLARANGTTTTYNFNTINQLDNFQQSFPNTTYNLTNSFLYNPAGQITQLTQSNSSYSYSGNDNRTGAYETNNLNQYTKINGQTLSYDLSGNLSNDPSSLLNYYYDPENRLISTSGVRYATLNMTLWAGCLKPPSAAVTANNSCTRVML